MWSIHCLPRSISRRLSAGRQGDAKIADVGQIELCRFDPVQRMIAIEQHPAGLADGGAKKRAPARFEVPRSKGMPAMQIAAEGFRLARPKKVGCVAKVGSIGRIPVIRWGAGMRSVTQRTHCRATLPTAASAGVASSPVRNHSMATAAATIAGEPADRGYRAPAGRDRIGPYQCSPMRANSTCSPNQRARFRITPTTAAVIAVSAEVKRRTRRSRST